MVGPVSSARDSAQLPWRCRVSVPMLKYLGVCWVGFSLVLNCAAQQASGVPTFEKLDANGDGKLSREELPERVRKNFERVDANKDGGISKEEHTAVLNRMKGQAGKGRGRA